MVLETDPVIFSNWCLHALWFFPAMLLGIGVVALAIGYTVAAVRYGPLRGGDVTFQLVKAGAQDLVGVSPRRVWALARLAIQESLRRRVWVTLVLFAMILAFAPWYLDPTSFAPARLYLDFVLNATGWLLLCVVLFLSVFSLPADLKNRTIYTVVTKPVRRCEIIIGRILGFSLVGATLLAIMGVCNYFFVVRGLNHTHEVDAESLKSDGSLTSGRTSLAQGHRHDLTINSAGKASTAIENGHWHEMIASDRAKGGYTLGNPQGLLVARVPQYGHLKFKDRFGKPSSKGISVGKEWAYQSFIEGGTLASAVWTFENITADQFPQGLPLEMTVRVFRSWKGKIGQGILGSLAVRNPKSGRTSSIMTFRAKDAQIDHRTIPLKLQDAANPSGPPLDLFKDLVSPEGNIEIILQCVEPAQYYGVAKADMYLKRRDASFEMNMLKGHLGILCQILLIVSFGVFFSTFLSGPVALLATLSAVVLGFCSTFVSGLVTGVIQGGGPVESAIRVVKQSNQTSPMEEGLVRDVVQAIDKVMLFPMEGACNLVPDFRRLSNSAFVAYGFDIAQDTVLVQLFLTAGYLLALVILGTFILKTREVAK